MKPELTKKIIASVLSLVLVTSVVFSQYGFAAAAALGDAISTNSNADYVEKETPDRDKSSGGSVSVATGSNAQGPGSAEVATGSNAIKGPGIKIEALLGEELAAYLMELDEEELLEALETLTDEQWESLVDVVSEEQLDEWLLLLASTKPVATAPTASFTDAGPLVEPVIGMMHGMFRSALMAQPIAEESDGVVLNKDVVSFNETTGEYKIRLEAYATGQVTTTESVVPTDIVLVLDQSGSMSENFSYEKVKDVAELNTSEKYYIIKNNSYIEISYRKLNGREYGWAYKIGKNWTKVNPVNENPNNRNTYYVYEEKTRLNVLKDAVTTFIEGVAVNATENNVDHRIAVVGFASPYDPSNGLYYGNTELLSTESPVMYKSSAYTDRNKKDALVSVISENGEINVRLTNAVGELAADGATSVDLGLEMAKEVLAKNPVGENGNEIKRNRIVIVFTDGVPTTFSDFSDDVANRAIKESLILKTKTNQTVSGVHGLGATVYSIGIFAGADPNANFTGNGETAKTNRFMHYVSTNYPNATSLSNGGTANTNKNYYLTAADEDDLNNIFQSISDQIESPSINLGESGVLKDIISPYFTLPSGFDHSKVSVSTADCIGKDGDTFIFDSPTPLANPSVVITGNQVSVSGFNYSENFVAVTDGNKGRGQKLIVEFPVVARDGFIGGNNVDTNTYAGIYQSQTSQPALKTAPSPEVNVEIQYDFTAKGEDIYIGDGVSLQELLDNTQYIIEGQKYTLGDGNNDFVTIEYQIKDGETTVATYTIPKGRTDGTWDITSPVAPTADKNYKITAVVKPVTEGAGLMGYQNVMTGHTAGTKNSSINVYKPEITTQDLAVYLTQKPEDLNLGIDSVEWKHGETTANPEVMGSAPELEYTFDWPTSESYPTEDTGVNIEKVTRADKGFVVKDSTNNYTTIHKTENNKEADFMVYVFKPEVPCTDEIVFYGDSTNLNQRIDTANISWKHETINSTELYPKGTAPDLTFAFKVLEGTALGNDENALTAFTPSEDTTFEIGAWVGDKDITNHTTRTNDGKTIADENPDFTIYVVKGQLNITKNITEQYTKNEVLNASQSFVFRIDRRDTPGGDVKDTFYEVISFNANDYSATTESKVIKGLKKGYYTVSEDTEWSWRYAEKGRYDNYTENKTECEEIFIGDNEIPTAGKPYFGVEENTVVKNVDISNPAVADFTNRRTNTKWLGDVARALNQIFKSANIKSDAE